VNFYMYIS